jgi:beta-lactamase superfamily II metal-dependent hydrolase
MGHQIDFIGVGKESSKSGDAIALRFGDLAGDRDGQFVMVIDGGTLESGEELVKQIETYYKTDRADLVISTHPDSDHASGLTVVLEKMKVNELWMHKPWEHAEDIRNLFQNDRITDASLRETLKRDLENAKNLATIAARKNIPIIEPFAGEDLGIPELTVLGPTREYYQSLLPHFRDTPEAKEAGFVQKAFQAAADAVTKWLEETWDIETLKDPSEEDKNRSAENASSVVLLLETDAKRFLFTGDASEPALHAAVDRAESLGIDLPSTLHFVQIPHHGSRRNVGPTLLNRMIGGKVIEGTINKFGIVSCAKDGEPKHPSKKVTNAFHRRGVHINATKGNNVCHGHWHDREGWSEAARIPFYDQVED